MKNPWLWLLFTAAWLWLAGRFFVEKYAPKPATVAEKAVERPALPDTIYLPIQLAAGQPVFWERSAEGYRIFFLENSQQPVVSPAAAVLLVKLAQKAAKNHQKIKLTGHTDEVGDAALNFKIGHLRARAVRKVLADAGLPEAEIVTDSEGESRPLVPNISEANRVKNRRVELVFQ